MSYNPNAPYSPNFPAGGGGHDEKLVFAAPPGMNEVSILIAQHVTWYVYKKNQLC